LILLDTSAVVLLFRAAEPPSILAGERVGISTIVETELFQGVFRGGGKKERRRVEGFIAETRVFAFDSSAAEATARLRVELWKSGTPIGDFDSQIAGHAMALDLPLLTDNVRHFERVEGLRIIPWRGADRVGF